MSFDEDSLLEASYDETPDFSLEGQVLRSRVLFFSIFFSVICVDNNVDYRGIQIQHPKLQNYETIHKEKLYV